MSTVVKSNDWCPTCLLQNKVQNVLTNRPGQYYTSCAANHQFSDTEELNTLRQMAKNKFPSLYQVAGPTPQDPAVLAGQDIVISAEVKKMLEELSGHPITSASDIKGLLYANVQDLKDKDSELRSARATIAAMGRRSAAGAVGTAATLQPGQFVVSIPEWAMEGVNGQAQHSDKTPEEWISEEFSNYFESYFGAPASR